MGGGELDANGCRVLVKYSITAQVYEAVGKYGQTHTLELMTNNVAYFIIGRHSVGQL